MPIKDKQKAREYKRLWIANRRKEGKNVEPFPFVEPKYVEPTENNFVEPLKSVEPNQSKVEPEKVVEPCSRCPEIENSISNFANLYQQEQDQNKEQKRVNQQLEKRIKELELKIISLQETNQILRKDLDYWQKPINPTIELWKTDYFKLEKKTDEQLNQQQETINRLKEKLRERTNENQAWEQKYSKLENQSKNNNNSLSLTNLNQLIEKHKHYQNSQYEYSDKDIREREFLKSLLDKLWSFAD